MHTLPKTILQQNLIYRNLKRSRNFIFIQLHEKKYMISVKIQTANWNDNIKRKKTTEIVTRA